MEKVFLIATVSLLCHGPHISEAAALDEPVTPASVTPGDVTTGAVVTTISSVQEQEEKCARDMNCKRCVALLECKFVTFEGVSKECMPLDGDLPPAEAGVPKIALNESECESGGVPDVTTLPPTDSTTTPVTTTSTETSTDSTTSTTTTPTSTTTETTTSSSSTTTSSTTTEAPATSAAPVPPPEPKGGHFDGWSFFGGILLTLGVAAIGFVGIKYYKLRSGTGGNYNRF